jgi:ABC-type uncharacterized transport system YnjBCD ATPase subunit
MIPSAAETKYFKDFEAREDAFRDRVFSLVARKYGGPGRFWNDFRAVSVDDMVRVVHSPIACITSNPRDCLAFGTPRQVLDAAVMCAGPSTPVADAVRRFDLGENIQQPLRTLSGGETVKLTLAKAWIDTAHCRQLAVASPFSWLSRENAVHFERLLRRCRRLSVPTTLFALEGEDSAAPLSEDDMAGFRRGALPFTMSFKDLRIPLAGGVGSLSRKAAHARVIDLTDELISPCLLVGDNGQGKTLVAKALARALAFDGDARIGTGKPFGSARLLFQDVITQTLLRSFNALARVDDPACAALYHRIAGRDAGAPRAMPASLLEVKAMLVARRLVTRPGALILDEPDWGLTRTAAIDFVLSVIDAAHDLAVPVLLISHKPWWQPLARSRVRVSRTKKSSGAASAVSFKITLQRLAPCGKES